MEIGEMCSNVMKWKETELMFHVLTISFPLGLGKLKH